MTVLVVDDDEDQLTIRCMLIAHHGFKTIRANAADSAAMLASAHNPDAAVIDIHLPTLEMGWRLLSALRASNPNIYLIVITGTDPSSLQQYPHMRFANEVIQKGSSAKELVSSLKRVSEHLVA